MEAYLIKYSTGKSKLSESYTIFQAVKGKMFPIPVLLKKLFILERFNRMLLVTNICFLAYDLGKYLPMHVTLFIHNNTSFTGYLH